MSDVEAIGDALTGGVVARAVEPKAGESADGHTLEHNCLNCKAPLTGPFCNQCGQQAHVHRTLAAFFHDFAHGVLHFEGKIWRTLPLLAWKPGELTRRYIDGQRASFVSPVALFLFSVFLMFAVLSWTGNLNPTLGANPDIVSQQRVDEQKIAKLQQERASRVTQKLPTMDIDADIRDRQEELQMLRDLQQHGVTTAVLNKNSTIDTDVPFLKEVFLKAKENPDLLLYKLKSNSYKWSWALIPLSVPFLWLLFPFSRRFRLYDHVVFVTYSLAFMTLLIAAGGLVSAIGIPGVIVATVIIAPVHMYRQLRGAYSLGRWGALWRTTALVVIALFVLIAFVALMGVLGALD
ncbi:DUF3667 domain-containing protein [Sphingomonas sp.]|uniref:DUF3667 domain-containing protein n=1 Tax=Sphingomonas sp. TaxID=28214 RepID=UPI0025F0AE2B|nr:DUF3667 domain-containing protein [Sphingomonas sp.]MBV9528191.1 DUF3667 domain-containing protein [Sphingomonas sp.]